MKLRTLLFLACLVSAGSSQGQNYQMFDGMNVTDCGGFFLDSGGGGNPYGSNQNFTALICPDGSTGTHIQLIFSGVDIAPGDLLCFYDGPDTGAPLIACNDDFLPGAPFIIQASAVNVGGCLTVTFNSDGANEADGWSAAIECVPACQLITSVISSSTPEIMPADTGYIDICPGDQVLLSGMGLYPQNGAVYNHSDQTSTFEWDFGDGTFGIGNNVSHVYNEPGGFVIQLTITDQFGCRNTNFISQRVRVATLPSFEITQDPQICVGDTVTLSSSVLLGGADSTATLLVHPPPEASFQVEGVRSDSLPLPDGTGAAYETSISFTEFSPGQVLTDLNDLLSICVNMEHSYLRDLLIQLTCPDGTTVTLHNFAGQIGGEVFLGEPFEADEGLNPPIPGVGYDYCWTPFDNNGFTWIQYANTFNPQTLPPGNYASFTNLNALLGCPLNGEWTIHVEDLWGVDNGYIFSWGISFNPDIYPNVETFTPNLIDWQWEPGPYILSTTQDTVVASPANAGAAGYQFTVFDDFGCVWDTLVAVEVLPFTHPDCYSCQDNIAPLTDETICEGDSVDFDADASNPNPAVTFEATLGYAFGFSNHPPNNPYEADIDVNSIIPATITDPFTDIASICIDLQTNFLSDIDVYLRSPAGDLLELTTGNGGGSDFYTQTCFVPGAGIPITAGTTPYTGNYDPEGNWAVLNGSPINGTWTLLVSDDSGATSMGVLNWWSITFNTQNQVSYTWSPTAGLTCNNCATPSASPATSTTYFVNSLDSYGCTSEDSVSVEVLPIVPAPVVSCQEIANGVIEFSWPQVDTFTVYEVNVNGQGWEAANGNLSHIVSGVMNGDLVSIQVQVVDNGSFCSVATGSAQCSSSCALVGVLTSQTDPSCHDDCNGSVQLSAQNAAAPVFYTLFHVDGLYTLAQDNGSFSGLCAGDHVVVLEDAAGCGDSLFFTLDNPEAITLSAMQTEAVSCNGLNDGEAIASAMGGSGNFSYLWNDPLMQILPTATLLEAGPVTVVATDANGCSASATITIDEPAPLVVSATGADALCYNEASGSVAAIVSGGSYPYSYDWNTPGGSADSLVAGLNNGTYSVQVTDQNGCTGSATVSIAQPASPLTSTIAQTEISCFGEDTGEAAVMPSGGTGPNYDIEWSSGDQTAVAADLAPGTYSVTIIDQNGCELEQSVQITEYQPVTLTVIFSPVSCNGLADGALAVTEVNGGTGSGILTYEWSADPTVNADVIEGLAGNMSYSVTVTDDNGCSGAKTVFIPEPPLMTIGVEAADVNCFDGEDGSATVTNINNAVGMVEYQWGPNAGNQTTATATDLSAGVYSVVVTDANGCTASGEVEVDQPSEIELTIDVVDNSCYDDAEGGISATAKGGTGLISYSWSTGSSGAQIGNLPAGFYVVTATDANGCTAMETVEVSQPEAIAPVVTATDVTCYGDRDGRVTLEPQGGTPPFLYSLDGETFYGSGTLIGLEAGEYTITILDGNNCSWTETAVINEPPPMEVYVDQGDRVEVELGESVALDAYTVNDQGGAEIFWMAPYDGTLSCTECFSTVSTTQNSITYLISAIDALGCEATTEVLVHINKERRVLVPPAFSPNNDSHNDRLLVHGKIGTLVTLFQVYDRWGELMYEARDFAINDPVTGWDGYFKGQLMNSGVFIWYVEVEYIDGVVETFKGSTTLIR